MPGDQLFERHLLFLRESWETDQDRCNHSSNARAAMVDWRAFILLLLSRLGRLPVIHWDALVLILGARFVKRSDGHERWGVSQFRLDVTHNGTRLTAKNAKLLINFLPLLSACLATWRFPAGNTRV